MRHALLIALLAGIGCAACGKVGMTAGPGPLREPPYVVVYGRDTCGITTRTLSALDRAGVPYEYKRVDAPAVRDELIPRMQAAGLDTRRYGLPVVDVNAEMIIRPKPDVVAAKYRTTAKTSKSRRPDREPGRADADPVEATRHLADPLVKCDLDGRQTLMLRSQCPN